MAAELHEGKLLSYMSYHEGKQSQEPGGRSGGRDYGRMLLTGRLRLDCSATLLTQLMPICPGMALFPMCLALPHQLKNKENAPKDMPQASSAEVSLQLRSPLPKRL